MSKKINVSEAADWSDEETAENLAYLETRGMLNEVNMVHQFRGGEPVATDPFPQPEVSARGQQGSSYPQPVEPTAADPDAVLSGTVQEVLDWVGDDPARAQAALDAEEAKEEPRVTLLEKLEPIAESGGDEEA